MARTKNSSDAVAKAATAVFNPVGMVTVHVVTPAGNEYDVRPREPFKIKAEDVAWFFDDWNWSFRQHLCLAEDYHPTCGYHDMQPGTKENLRSPILVRQFAPKADTAPSAADEENTEPEPEAKLEPESDEGQNPEKE